MIITTLSDNEFKIAQIICEHYDISMIDMFKLKGRKFTAARNIFFICIRECFPELSVTDIMRRFPDDTYHIVRNYLNMGLAKYCKHRSLYVKLYYRISKELKLKS